MIEQGTITPITPLTTFDVSQLEQALLFFSRGKHMGKIVIDYTKENSIVKVCSTSDTCCCIKLKNSQYLTDASTFV